MPLTSAERSRAFRERHGDEYKEYIRQYHRDHNDVICARRREQKAQYYLASKGRPRWQDESARFLRILL